MSDIRGNIRMPSNRAEERLHAVAVPEFPPATPGIAQDELVEEVTASLRQALEHHPEVMIATDGSSKEDLGRTSPHTLFCSAEVANQPSA